MTLTKADDIFMTIESSRELLKASLYDYGIWKRKGYVGQLRDAGNKLLGVLEDFTSSKVGYKFNGYKDFRKTFYNLNTKIGLKQKKDLMKNIFLLHLFFYYGLIEDQTVQDVVDIYLESYKIVKRVVY